MCSSWRRIWSLVEWLIKSGTNNESLIAVAASFKTSQHRFCSSSAQRPRLNWIWWESALDSRALYLLLPKRVCFNSAVTTCSWVQVVRYQICFLLPSPSPCPSVALHCRPSNVITSILPNSFKTLWRLTWNLRTFSFRKWVFCWQKYRSELRFPIFHPSRKKIEININYVPKTHHKNRSSNRSYSQNASSCLKLSNGFTFASLWYLHFWIGWK